MPSDFSEVIGKLQAYQTGLPHNGNFITKLRGASLTDLQLTAAQRIVPEYLQLCEILDADESDIKKWLTAAIDATDNYIKVLDKSENKKFSHQSDFISSVVPELFFYLFQKFVIHKSPDMTIEAQKNIIIDVEFVPTEKEVITLKKKRVDLAILLPCSLVINNEEINNFNLPILAAEVKTNLDKNMISGIEHSAESFKKAFPLSKYFVIAEWSDFNYRTQNYATSFIDEIYILRKQARSVYRATATSKKIDLSLMMEIAERAADYVQDIKKESVTLHDRMLKGKLIKDTVYED